jgi:hypothetical protein
MAGTARSSLEQGDNRRAEFFELVKQHNYVIDDLETLRQGVAEFVATAAWDLGSCDDQGFVALDVTVTGAALGDFVDVSLSLDTADLTVFAAVTATNTVTITVINNTQAGVDLLTPTYYLRVSSPGLVDAAGDLVAATVNAQPLGT